MKTGIETMATEFGLYTCKTCGQDFPIQVEKYFTTYGTDREGNKHCVECCGKNDLADALKSGRWTGYLTYKDSPQGDQSSRLSVPKRFRTYWASNWPGTLKIEIRHVSESRHNFGGWTLGEITEDWFSVGCHKITFKELDRLADLAGLIPPHHDYTMKQEG